MRQLMEFFTVHQLPPELSVRCYKLYGEQSMELLYDDPYLLMADGLDAPFQAVDRFAIELGISAIDPRRIEAGIIFELSYNLTGGHSFLPEDKLIVATAQLLSVEPDRIAKGIHRLLETDRLVKCQLAGITVIYLPEMYLAETYSAQRLLEFSQLKFPEPKRLDAMVAAAGRHSQVEYSQRQTEAIRQAASSALI
jgi:exodeoxyribonuclease V alpha subunit